MIAALLLLAALALVVACGVFVAAEFALLAVDRPGVERSAAAGSRSARGTLAALTTLSTQLSGVQIGITLTNLAIGLLAEPALATLLEPPLRSAGLGGEAVPTVAVAIGLVVSTLLTMLIGELVPKNLAIALPMRVAGAVQAPVRAFTRAIAWPIRWLNGLADALLHRAGLEAKEELSSARTAEELLAVVRRSAQQGSLESDTAGLLARSLLFGRRRAVDVMTPRTRMQTVAATDSVATLVGRVAATGFSRLPVTGEGVDDIVGLGHIRAAIAVPRAERDTTAVSQVMARPVLVPATLPLDELLDRLRDHGTQLAVVIDEYGGTDGLVTLEDLAEELVGEVTDEFDADADADPAGAVTADGEGWIVPGSLTPGDASFALGRRIASGPWSTVAGLFLEHYQQLPEVGDSIVVDGLEWTVRERTGRRIVSLRVAPHSTPPSDGGAADE